MSNVAKAVYFTIAGKEINVIVHKDYYGLFLEGLLRKVFRTVRTEDVDWPDAKAIYDKAKADLVKEGFVGSNNQTTTRDQEVKIVSVWYKSLSKDCTVLVAKALFGSEIKTVVHNNTFTPGKAHTMAKTIKQVGSINLNHWR